MHQDLAALQLVEAQTVQPTVEALEEEDVVWQVNHPMVNSKQSYGE
jgi:hypothetical protein